MLITTFPANCTLLEWNEKQQTFYLNRVSDNEPNHLINRHGVLIIYVCETYKEAHILIEYLEERIQKPAAKYGKEITTLEMSRHAKAVMKFAKAYNKIVDRYSKT